MSGLNEGAGVRPITEADREKVLMRFNDTAVPYPQDRLIHELFEEQVRCTPDAIAVVSEEQSLTYAQLNAKANQLAGLLLRRGARIGEYIPILMPRSLELVIAQLAVLKSGAVYVPVDPKLPVERQTFMIRDCQAHRILVAHSVSERFDASSVEWIDCTPLARELAELPGDNVGLRIPAPPAAYVMYTSGSTGSPKGVVISHRGVNRLVINSTYARIEPEDCIVHSNNPAFDASTFEIWAALLNGARLLIVPAPVVLDVGQFAETLKNNGVSILLQTTSLFNQFSVAFPGVFGGLRYLLFGGETSDANSVRRVLGGMAPKHLLHVYGPTEATSFATWYPVDSLPERSNTVPIGKPISNTQVYILDGQLRPVSIGMTGEIYIGGPGVALGYLNRPGQTAEHFLPNPYDTNPGERLYRSGDMGRWDVDGNIEFLGRGDQQVKLRGHRIELDEIAAHLVRQDAVGEALVIIRDDTPAGRQLVAYVTPMGGAPSDASSLLEHLGSTLPEYMVPSAIVVLNRLPLTANGKIDRRALPAPERDAYRRQQYQPPVTDVERSLAVIWQELLSVDLVGRDDNFFKLGGHSLAAMKLTTKLSEAFSIHLSFIEVFEHPILRQLAGTLEKLLCDRQRLAVDVHIKLDEGMIRPLARLTS